jgi:hypothetical protein
MIVFLFSNLAYPFLGFVRYSGVIEEIGLDISIDTIPFNHILMVWSKGKIMTETYEVV